MAMGREERAEKCGLPLKLALHRAARGVGIQYIAATYGHGYTALANNLNPEQPERAPTLQQFEDITQAAVARGKESVIAESLGDLLGGVFIKLPDLAGINELGMLGSLAELTEEVSRLARHVGDSLQDGFVDSDELAMLNRDVKRLYGAAKTLIAAAERAGVQRG